MVHHQFFAGVHHFELCHHPQKELPNFAGGILFRGLNSQPQRKNHGGAE